jgi:hypothetical protein
MLEVDHIHDLALGGDDSPAQMIALCPNCHQVKTREQLRGSSSPRPSSATNLWRGSAGRVTLEEIERRFHLAMIILLAKHAKRKVLPPFAARELLQNRGSVSHS